MPSLSRNTVTLIYCRLTLGGGWGYLSASYGLAIDNLEQVSALFSYRCTDYLDFPQGSTGLSRWAHSYCQ